MTFANWLKAVKWHFYEAGMLPMWQRLQLFGAATVQGNVTGAAGIGAVDMDTAATPGLTAGVEALVHPPGQLNTVTATALDYGTGAAEKVPPTQTR